MKFDFFEDNLEKMRKKDEYPFLDIYDPLIPRFKNNKDKEKLASKYNAINRVGNDYFWGLIRGDNDNTESERYAGLSIIITHSIKGSNKVNEKISYYDVQKALGKLDDAAEENKTDEEIKAEKEEKDKNHDILVVTLSVGFDDYGADASLARRPGTRRKFVDLLKYNECYLCAGVKRNLLDNESDIFKAQGKALGKALGHDGDRTVLAYFVVDVKDEKGQWLVYKFFQAYAEIREWPLYKDLDSVYKSLFKEMCPSTNNDNEDNDKKIVKQLLENRRFVVLQGAPGTGKTRLAKEIAASENSGKKDNIVFTQFHAETSYADFVSGIFPVLTGNNENENSDLRFEEREGALVKAIRKARAVENKGKKVFLIIDEINRANLANVLGEAFYLFEPDLSDDGPTVKLAKDMELSALPKNLYVIATMNTADRSLAVVDFALRRRFAWYTMTPHKITPDKGYYFYRNEFNELSDLFNKYATDDELNLKPGHAYFIVKDDEKRYEIFKDRLRYEIMPLIKEYISEGMLLEGAEAFECYFRKHLNEGMFY